MTTAQNVLFSGQVQGVGFRMTTTRLARGFAVAGWVRNLADGRVELRVEAEQEEAARFLHAVRNTLRGYITREECTEVPVQGISGFGIT